MNTFATLAALALFGVGLLGCSKKSDSSSKPTSSAKGERGVASATTPGLQLLLTDWQQGNKSAEVNRFLATDWSARPLFTPGSALSLSEAQFRSLTLIDRDAKSREITPDLRALKELADAVAQAGRDAAARKDSAQARKYFTSLKQCGEAIESSDSVLIVTLLGKAVKTKGDNELGRMGR